jgi:hypothetical protein
MLRATLLAIAVVLSMPAAAQMAGAPRPAYPAVHSIAGSSGAREPRRQTRREPVNRSSGTFAAGALGNAGVGRIAPSWDSTCPAPYKRLAGTCVPSCLGGYEDRGAFCSKIDH